MSQFENKVFIVSGGTRGIGREITTDLLKQGGKVVALFNRNEVAANEFARELSQFEGKLIVKKCDVSSESEVKDFFNWFESLEWTLFGLVNNAGIRKDQVLALMEYEQWSEVLKTNLDSTFLMSKHAVPLMMRAREGRIVNISSIGGKLCLQGQANYAASKAGQIAITKTLAKEVAKKKITVNCVAPGFIETELLKDLDASLIDEYKKQVPMRRFGKAQEVADAVSFLLSDKASYITGVCLDVSGGL